MTTQIRIDRIESVSERTGLPKPSIYRLMKNGQFPKSVKLSARASGWRSSDIDAWIEQLETIGAE
jgi:prophage regulatory protein